MRRLFVVLVSGVFVAFSGTAPALAQGSWACAASYYATCYIPSKVSQAERAMPVKPVNPSRAVFQATHLRLARVAVSRGGFNAPARAIFYSYGVALAIDQRFPRTDRKYVLVVESPLRTVSFPGMRINSTQFGSQLATSLRKHKLSLVVYGNLDRATIKKIGLAIRRS